MPKVLLVLLLWLLLELDRVLLGLEEVVAHTLHGESLVDRTLHVELELVLHMAIPCVKLERVMGKLLVLVELVQKVERCLLLGSS